MFDRDELGVALTELPAVPARAPSETPNPKKTAKSKEQLTPSSESRLGTAKLTDYFRKMNEARRAREEDVFIVDELPHQKGAETTSDALQTDLASILTNT